MAQVPSEESKPRLDRVDWALLASDAGARALDTYSTQKMLSDRNREEFLPETVANNTALLATFEGGMVTLNYFVARNLVRHHHRKLARFVVVADMVQVYPWAIHNLTLPSDSKSRVFAPR